MSEDIQICHKRVLMKTCHLSDTQETPYRWELQGCTVRLGPEKKAHRRKYRGRKFGLCLPMDEKVRVDLLEWNDMQRTLQYKQVLASTPALRHAWQGCPPLHLIFLLLQREH